LLRRRGVSIDIYRAPIIRIPPRDIPPFSTVKHRDVDGCEVNKEKAYRVNYLATVVLAKASTSAEFFVYISTDYVFDGSRGMYRESDVPAPVNYYGLSKLLGEVAVTSALGSSCVVRVYDVAVDIRRGFHDSVNMLVLFSSLDMCCEYRLALHTASKH
jgi:hypothetical protein